MANKIAKVDAEAMNSLYASELTRMGATKTAADDEKGAPHDPQAFEDHSEYLETLKSVMSEDKKTDFSPNDPVLD
jgi:hypothetical protein